MDRDNYLGNVGGVLLKPPELDAKLNTELGDLESQVPGISINEHNNWVWDVIDPVPFNNVSQDVQKNFCGHPALLRVANSPLAGDPISPHPLQLVGGHVPSALVHQPDGEDVTTGSDGDRSGGVLLAAATLVVENILDPHVSEDLDVFSTSCQGSLILI